VGIGLLQNFAYRFSFQITRKQFQIMYQKSIITNWYDSKNIDFFIKLHCYIKTNRGFHETSLSQKNWIALQETGVTAIHVKTEALARIKLPVIVAFVHLHTLDQDVKLVSEIFSWCSTCLSKWLFNKHILMPFPNCIVQ